MNSYDPGLHIVCTFTAAVDKLTNADGCRQLFDRLIEELQLVKVGEVYHSFPASGFTAVVCLTESHVSIHTWPEFGQATFDVFLSNFNNNNTEKVRKFYTGTIAHFEGVVTNMHELVR